jgi:hypothetical protein
MGVEILEERTQDIKKWRISIKFVLYFLAGLKIDGEIPRRTSQK